MLSVRSLFLAVVALLCVLAFGAAPAFAVSPNLVVSQVYGGGGNTGAPYTHDYIEIFNRGTSTVGLSGYSLQYASATGTGNFGANSGQITELPGGALAPGQYWLVQESGGTTGSPLPFADVVDATPINMSATGGKVAIVSGTTPLGCNGGSTPCDAAALARIVDLLGYDGANFFEGAPTPALTNTTAAFRRAGGCQDTDNNGVDFAVAAPSPRSALSPFNFCPTDNAPTITDRTPASGATGVAADSNVTITFSEPVNVSGTWFVITCVSGNHPATVTGGPVIFTLDPTTDFSPGESCNVVVFGANVHDQDALDPPDNMAGNESWNFTIATPSVRIHDIQGATHVSPLVGQAVSGVTGIVTAKRSNGYYMQDPDPDADDATSEGIFVFTSSAPNSVNVGDSVRVSGRVAEFRAGGSSSANLSTTEITGPTTTVLSTGNALPAPTVVGAGGRIPPAQVIEDDATGDVETSGVFDPAQDGIDFYETLEGMRLQVDDPVVVGPRNSFGEIYVLGDDGAAAAARTARGGIVIRDLGPEAPGDYASGDFNPERIQLDDAVGVATPNANVGDHFTGPAVGVLDYDFGNFEIEVTSALTRVADGVTRETTAPSGSKELTVGTFNVENLDAAEPQSKFDALAAEIVNNMRSPDVLSLEEIQDNNGAVNDPVVDAGQTYAKLITAIQGAGGPAYDYRQINPVDDQDGGEPGGNIRVGFLYRTDRGLAFVDRPGGDSTTPTAIVAGPDGKPQLSASPGRVAPANAAWNASRKPLAGEFTYRGERFFLVTNHFNSKGGDQPLFGHFQPPVRSSEVQRHQQAQLVNDFVDSILGLDANANVIVLGDLNDFEFSQTVSLLEGGVMHALMKTLPQNERYSYVFEGNSQSLDHVVVSDRLFGNPFVYDPVHVNAEFFDQLSDHDPQVARFYVNDAPTADAGGPYTVAEGSSVQLSATGSDPNGDALAYAWDLDNNGTFETPGQIVTFSPGDGPVTATVKVRVTDDGGLSKVASATVQVTNVPPQITSVTPGSPNALVGQNVTFTGVATDVSTADTSAGFTWAFDTGSGFGTFGSNGFVTSYPACGTYTVDAEARDKDGGVSAPFTSSPVHVFAASVLPPLTGGAFNVVQRGRVVPVKVIVGCNGFVSGLHPAISIRSGDYDPGVEASDPSYEVPETVSSADTSGVMREVDDHYTYNLGVPSNATSGQLYTVLVRPFGGSSPTFYAVLKIK